MRTIHQKFNALQQILSRRHKDGMNRTMKSREEYLTHYGILYLQVHLLCRAYQEATGVCLLHSTQKLKDLLHKVDTVTPLERDTCMMMAELQELQELPCHDLAG